MNSRRVCVSEITKVLLEDPKVIWEWQQFYKDLNLEIDNSTELQMLYASKNYRALPLIGNILEQWVSERGSNATIQALMVDMKKTTVSHLNELLAREFLLTSLVQVGGKNDFSEEEQIEWENALAAKYKRVSSGVKICNIYKDLDSKNITRGSSSRVRIFVSHLLRMLHKVKDFPVVILSINGELRSGKSFLVNQMIKFLYALHHGTTNNWLETPLQSNFEWNGGDSRVTSGIQVWYEPIVVKTESGRHIAVIVIDTQGLFDQQTTSNENSVIFGFSLLLSSLFIFNQLSSREDTLQHLEAFLEFTKFASEGTGNEAALFQNLVCLYRDWRNANEFKCGYYDAVTHPQGSTKNLWREKLTSSSESMTREAKQTRGRIVKSFQATSVYAMARPQVLPDDDGIESSSDWDMPFRNSVAEFVSRFLAPSKLEKYIKTICGNVLTAGELMDYIRIWPEHILSAEGQLQPGTVYEKTAQIFCNKLIADLVKEYETYMKTLLKSNSSGLRNFLSFHGQKTFQLQGKFNSSKVYGGKPILDQYIGKLVEDLQKSKISFQAANDVNLEREDEKLCNSKIEHLASEYGQLVGAYISSNPKGVTDEIFQAHHQQRLAQLKDIFNRVDVYGGSKVLLRFVVLLENRIFTEMTAFAGTNKANVEKERQRVDAEKRVIVLRDDNACLQSIDDLAAEYEKFLNIQFVAYPTGMNSSQLNNFHNTQVQNLSSKYGQVLRSNSRTSENKHRLAPKLEAVYSRAVMLNQGKVDAEKKRVDAEQRERARHEEQRQRLERQRVEAENKATKAFEDLLQEKENQRVAAEKRAREEAERANRLQQTLLSMQYDSSSDEDWWWR